MAMYRPNPVNQMDALLSAASTNVGQRQGIDRTIIPRDQLDLSHITNNEDRRFVEELYDDMLKLEPGNDLIVEFFDNGPMWLMTVTGLRNPIDDTMHARFRARRHPINGHIPIPKTQIIPPKGLDGLKFAVHIVPSGPKLARQQQIAHQHHLPNMGMPPPQQYPPHGLVPLAQDQYIDPGPPNYGQTMVKGRTVTKSKKHQSRRNRDSSPVRSLSSSSSSSSSSSEDSGSGESVLGALARTASGMFGGDKSRRDNRRRTRGRR